jgi:hypothetical protein
MTVPGDSNSFSQDETRGWLRDAHSGIIADRNYAKFVAAFEVKLDSSHDDIFISSNKVPLAQYVATVRGVKFGPLSHAIQLPEVLLTSEDGVRLHLRAFAEMLVSDF